MELLIKKFYKHMDDSKNKIILVVEDDRLLNNLLVERLKISGFQAVGFLNGEDALEYLKDNKPSAILLDLLLPGIDGFQVLTKIRENPDTKKVPVMVVSNVDQEDYIKRARTIGIDDYLLKAVIDLNELVSRLRVLLE